MFNIILFKNKGYSIIGLKPMSHELTMSLNAAHFFLEKLAREEKYGARKWVARSPSPCWSTSDCCHKDKDELNEPENADERFVDNYQF